MEPYVFQNGALLRIYKISGGEFIYRLEAGPEDLSILVPPAEAAKQARFLAGNGDVGPDDAAIPDDIPARIRNRIQERRDHLALAGRVIDEVSVAFGVDPDDVKKTRTHSTTLARHLTMYLLHEVHHLGWSAIGRIFGMNHATAILAHRKVSQLINENAKVRLFVRKYGKI